KKPLRKTPIIPAQFTMMVSLSLKKQRLRQIQERKKLSRRRKLSGIKITKPLKNGRVPRKKKKPNRKRKSPKSQNNFYLQLLMNSGDSSTLSPFSFHGAFVLV